MNKTTFRLNDSFKEYRAVLEKVAAFSEKIFSLHGGEISCQEGCSRCCVEGLSVLPVEAHYIKAGLRQNDLITVPQTVTAHCVFLDSQGACQIYEYRPIVCRTHGLPLHRGTEVRAPSTSTLRVLNDDITTCDLNFTTRRHIEKEKALDEVTLQKLLFVVNARFCEQNDEKNPSKRSLLRELAAGKEC